MDQELILVDKYKNKIGITPDEIRKLNKFTNDFLCDISDNSYSIDFTKLKIRNLANNETLVEISKPQKINSETDIQKNNNSRTINYCFPEKFLRFKSIGTTVEFRNGPKPIKNFFMIERHYFNNELVKSFEFNFGFIMENSTNTIEHIYELPNLSEKRIKEMVSNPNGSNSDTFYFIDEKLIMHHKSFYKYIDAI